MNSRNRRMGFTIVELLIVVVVIAILATIAVVSYNGISVRARDTDRVTDINTIQKKLEVFYATNGYYPSAADMSTTTYRTTTLDLPMSATSPPGSVNQISYCWATHPQTYCYVPARASGLSGDCFTAAEKCISYVLSYWLEAQTGVRYAYSAN